MSDKNSWEKMCMGIQERSLGNTLLEVKSAKVLRSEIVKCLTSASDDKILNAKLDEILKLIKIAPSSQVPKSGYQEIMGGDKNQNRELHIPHFKLYNGCWFDFAITIDETTRHAQVIAFDFEIRFPKRKGEIAFPFLRIDLNLPNHKNEEKNMRFHLHPSHEDISIHSPPMSPLEILHMFLYGMDTLDNDKPRSF